MFKAWIEAAKNHCIKTYSDSYTDEWAHEVDIFCAHCGKRDVWSELGPGDFYVGTQYICIACGWTFQMPHLGETSESADLQRLAQLRRMKAGDGRCGDIRKANHNHDELTCHLQKGHSGRHENGPEGWLWWDESQIQAGAK